MDLKVEPVVENGPYWEDVGRLAREAFPPGEYFSPRKLMRMAQADDFDFWKILVGSAFVGFMVVKTYDDLAYLFFLAIDPSHRSKGYGARVLARVRTLYPQKRLILDFEMLDETAANSEQRKKRRAFYLRNGFQETGWFVSYNNIDFEIVSADGCLDLEKYKALMLTLEIEHFHPRYFRKDILSAGRQPIN